MTTTPEPPTVQSYLEHCARAKRDGFKPKGYFEFIKSLIRLAKSTQGETPCP